MGRKTRRGRVVADATGGIATGLYWVATGKLPLEDLDEKQSPKELKIPENQKPKGK
jgi:hypothetical protein